MGRCWYKNENSAQFLLGVLCLCCQSGECY